MITDFFLASLHHLAAFALVAIVVCELVLVRPGIDGATAKRIATLDVFYGLRRCSFSSRGSDDASSSGPKAQKINLASLAFWAKISLFIGMGLLSILPTLRFIAWRRKIACDPCFVPDDAELRMPKRYIHAEAGLLVLLPILAAALARGY